MNPEALIPLNPRDYLILFSLAAGKRHGYGIVKDMERDSQGRVRIDPANLYRSLKRLIASGLVEDAGSHLAADAQEERRRYYRITGFGRQVLQLEAMRLADLTAAARKRDLIPAGKGVR